MNNTIISLDLAKNIIQVCKVSRHGEIIFNKAMKPHKVKELLANSAPCIVAMEGCGSFHYWARYAQQLGHQIRGMNPKKVKPFIGQQKTDANDAVGIAVAAGQFGMTFCVVKNEAQQSIQAIQTSRKWLDRSLTSMSNHLRALCYEYGLTIPKGKKGLREKLADYMADERELPDLIKQLLLPLWEHYQEIDKQHKTVTSQLKSVVNHSEPCQRLMKLEGVSHIGAAGLWSSLGNGKNFKNGRQASVYLGATPKQHSSGGKVIMVGISKTGDNSLRSVLYQGALSVISKLPEKPNTHKQLWLLNLLRRVGIKRACIALVNKTIRTAWALLNNGTEYQVAVLENA